MGKPSEGEANAADEDWAMDQLREEAGSEYYVKFSGTGCLSLAPGFVLNRLGEQPPTVACTTD